MPSPFPGMDPYVEAWGTWQDFHNALIALVRNALGLVLPDDYIVRIDEAIRLVYEVDEPPRGPRPDVIVARDPWAPVGGAGGAEVVAVGLEPVAVLVARDDPQEIRDTWVEIRRVPDLELVTVVEILSPSNKQKSGRAEYLDKRWATLAGPTHLVEIDLLLGGIRPPLSGSKPQGDYYATVSRAGRRPLADVYAWSIRRPLPTIPIPLKEPDRDVPLDLAPLVSTVYDLGRYGRSTDYAAPLDLPLAPEDRAWAREIASAAAAARRRR